MEIEGKEKTSIEEWFEKTDQPEYIKGLMEKNRVNTHHIAEATGLNYASIYQYIWERGNRRMTKTMKVIFYLYFRYVIKVEF